LIVSTLNRTLRSLLLGKIAAEYVLRWLPRGTHDWSKFLLPSEVEALFAPHGMRVRDVTGIAYNPLRGAFTAAPHDLGINYLMSFTRRRG
jgi:2-polyprenyl-6-hydroxyphenyl methylase/3-demethylubiquinone-9 3-methyltransferase